MKLSPNYTVDDWRAAFTGEPDWGKAIDIVEDRISGRFVRWIDQLLPKEFAGFAVLALDCLFLETLYGFRRGASTYDTRTAYKTILMEPPFGFDETLAVAFYDNIRCGIIHDTETRRGWLVRMTPQRAIVEQDPSGVRVLNRTMFHNTLKQAFEDWIAKLRTGNASVRDKMRDRMEEIITKHYTP